MLSSLDSFRQTHVDLQDGAKTKAPGSDDHALALVQNISVGQPRTLATLFLLTL